MSASGWEPHFAYFISPHGFGHATRAVAVLEAFFEQVPKARVTLFTTVPKFLFNKLPQDQVEFVSLACDVGLVQASALDVDLQASREVLSTFWPPVEEQLSQLVEMLQARSCAWVVCDIAPLGILAAQRAGISAVLIENFTWDWIYAGIPRGASRLKPFISAFAELFGSVDHHIQARPTCQQKPDSLEVDLIVRPIQQDRISLRQSLGIHDHQRVVLVTMGGLGQGIEFVEGLKAVPELVFLIPGITQRHGNVIGLGKSDQFYHPDWVFAADLVVGKLGYSTVAEVVQAGTPMAFVNRPEFPESAVLAEFVKRSVPTIELVNFGKSLDLRGIAEHARVERSSPRVCEGAHQVVAYFRRAFHSRSDLPL